jgi:glycosyltransferase involved in cell wall biosynthesis
MAARIQREKGQLRAIEAARLLIASGREVDLRIVGDGDTEPCCEAIERAGLGSAVTLAGFVSNLDGEYLDSHLALSCSRIEAMGRMTAEAMSFALPVVGCDSLGTAEIVQHEMTGLLCDGSAAEIARAVERLIVRPDEARHIGLQAQEFARRTFADETCTRAALEVLRRVCARSVSTAPYLGAVPQLAGASER